ncbi:MAG: ATP-binding cassette domain-containing protein [Verrucomicrobiales bacterium]|nr:ATP-binding cassette domain-containing protein [Verrucomicrobiales bacterium]
MQPDNVIEVSRLSKRYGRVVAVDDLSFTLGPREILGFLGPNGAGKSTTMRVLAGFLPATSGTARITGLDVFHDAAEVRRRIGYMPENNPLPTDMRVREYLKFRARLKGLHGSECRERVDVVQEMCGLRDVGRRIIGTLSKGYRQRVGLADALVHDPPLLILDEPTIGLDPNQIRSLRQLIKDLAQRRTVLLSSHILPEVEMTCTRVLIMHRGRIRAAGTTQDLQGSLNSAHQIVAEVRAPEADLRECWETMPEIASFDVSAASGDYFRCALTPLQGTDLRDRVYDEVRQRGWALRELTFTRHSLEDIFVHLTRAERSDE